MALVHIHTSSTTMTRSTTSCKNWIFTHLLMFEIFYSMLLKNGSKNSIQTCFEFVCVFSIRALKIAYNIWSVATLKRSIECINFSSKKVDNIGETRLWLNTKWRNLQMHEALNAGMELITKFMDGWNLTCKWNYFLDEFLKFKWRLPYIMWE